MLAQINGDFDLIIHRDLRHIFRIISTFMADIACVELTHQDTSHYIRSQSFGESSQTFISANSDHSANGIRIQISLGRRLHPICTHSHQYDLSECCSAYTPYTGRRLLPQLGSLSFQQVLQPLQHMQLSSLSRASHLSFAECYERGYHTMQILQSSRSFDGESRQRVLTTVTVSLFQCEHNIQVPGKSHTISDCKGT
jgi:hypothetical protein